MSVKNLPTGIINHILDKAGKLPEELSNLAKDRAGICAKCEQVYLDDNKNIYRCGVCKCYLHFKTKVKEEKCPQGKW